MKKVLKRLTVLFIAVSMILTFSVTPLVASAAPSLSIKLDASKGTIYAGTSMTLHATVSSSDSAVVWSTSNKKVATVSQDGVVTGVKKGTAYIYAKIQGTRITTKCRVTVAAPTVTIAKTSVAYIGIPTQLTATTAPNPSAAVVWSTSNKKVATVSQDGVVTGVKKGTAYIYAQLQGTKTKVKCKVSVKVPTLVSGLNVDPTSVAIDLGSVQKINSSVSPTNATYQTLNYASSNSAVASVSSDGTITGNAPGTATVTLATKDGSNKSATVSVTVKEIKAKSISPTSLSVGLKEGETSQLDIAFSPENTTNKSLEFYSNNSQVATVSPTGRIVAIKEGSAEITAVTLDGSNKSTTINVVVNPVKATSINATVSKTTLMQGEKMQISASVAPANASIKDLKFTSSDPFAATVSNTGEVTALAQGFTTITVEAVDGSGIKKEIDLTIDLDRSDMPKVILTTDGEVDDQNSLIHFLLYANEVDCLGIVQSSSQHHWEGSPNAYYQAGKSPYRWPGRQFLPTLIDAYEKVYPNLRVHDSRYPTPNYLRSIAKIGNVGFRGDMSGPTDGSNLIKDAIIDHVNNNEPGILYITAWGGPNTGAMALKQIEDEYKNAPGWNDLHNKISEKVAFSSWGSQDNTRTIYVTPAWPDIKWLNGSADYGYNASSSGAWEKRTILGGAWMREHIDYGHGALLDHYVNWGDGYNLDYEPPRARFGDYDMANNDNWFSNGKYPRYEFLSEGDSPTFFYFFDNGLRNWEDGKVNVNWGGWSGRCSSTSFSLLNDYVTTPTTDSGTPNPRTEGSMSRWVPYLHYDFAARADWCVTPNYSGANHRPDIKINGGLDLTAAPGEKVFLNAKTSDPDGDNVNVNWWHYVEAGTDAAGSAAAYATALTINQEQGSDAGNPIVSFTIPEDATPGKTYHIIAEATDDGAPHKLTYFQRVIVTVEAPEDIGMKIVVPRSLSDNNNTLYSNVAGDDKLIWAEFDRPRTGVTVGWYSSNPAVMTVTNNDKYGDTYHTVISSVASGSTTITAVASTGQVATIDLNVKMVGTVSAITVPAGMNANAIPLGGPVPLTATTTLANGGPVGITWESDDPSVVTVDANGVITPVREGTAIISATTDDDGGARNILRVTIVPGASIVLPEGKKANAIDVNGGTFALTAKAAPVAVQSCVWSSGTTSVATVDSSGNVTPVAAGNTTITATATLADGSASVATVKLVVIKPVTGITITSPVGNTISANTTLTAACTPGDATTQTVRWYTSDPSVATINSSTGALVPMSQGPVTITAVANDGSGVKGTIDLTVAYNEVASITLAVPGGVNKDAIPVGGGNVALTATVAPGDALKQNLTWTTTNTRIATVSTSGVVTPKGPGKVIVIASSNDGSQVVGTITLKIFQNVTGIALSAPVGVDTSNIPIATGNVQLTATVSPDTALNKTVTWSSGSDAIATVNSTGRVTLVSAGTVTITATAADGSGTVGTINLTIVGP